MPKDRLTVRRGPTLLQLLTNRCRIQPLQYTELELVPDVVFFTVDDSLVAPADGIALVSVLVHNGKAPIAAYARVDGPAAGANSSDDFAHVAAPAQRFPGQRDFCKGRIPMLLVDLGQDLLDLLDRLGSIIKRRGDDCWRPPEPLARPVPSSDRRPGRRSGSIGEGGPDEAGKQACPR